MGDVYQARDAEGRHIAVKVFASRWTRDPERARGARRELERGSALGRPTLAGPLEIGRLTSGRTFVASPWIPGKDLATLLTRGPLDPRLVAELLGPVAAALDALHDAGIVHRTLSASKIRLTDEPRPRVVLTGYGAAPLVSAPSILTSPTAIAYLAPEAARAAHDRRLDVYALTVLAFRMIAGAFPHPIHGVASYALRDRHAVEAPSLRQIGKRPMASALEEVVRRGLAHDPEQRYASAGELVAEMRDALGLPRTCPTVGPAVEALLGTAPTQRVTRRARRVPLREPSPLVATPGEALALGTDAWWRWGTMLTALAFALLAVLLLAR